MKPLIIAIDGPAASGKSSTAGAVARALDLPHVDSGALYRAVTWRGLEDRATAPDEFIAAADVADLRLVRVRAQAFEVRMGQHNIEQAIRSAPVTAGVSAVSAMPTVRDWVDQRLREALADSGGVMDGRDIGTVVFPDADLKVFLTATADARARRRLRQTGALIDAGELAREVARLEERDRLDSSRAVAPLRQAPDARLLDTSAMTFDEQVARIVEWAREILHPDT